MDGGEGHETALLSAELLTDGFWERGNHYLQCTHCQAEGSILQFHSYGHSDDCLNSLNHKTNQKDMNMKMTCREEWMFDMWVGVKINQGWDNQCELYTCMKLSYNKINLKNLHNHINFYSLHVTL